MKRCSPVLEIEIYDRYCFNQLVYAYYPIMLGYWYFSQGSLARFTLKVSLKSCLLIFSTPVMLFFRQLCGPCECKNCRRRLSLHPNLLYLSIFRGYSLCLILYYLEWLNAALVIGMVLCPIYSTVHL
jgi:hypothetical protein